MSQRLIAELDRVAARWRWATCATAVAWGVGVALSVAMLLVLVDWIGRFNDPGLRWLFSGVFVAAMGTAVYRGWNQLRTLQATRLAVARKAEELHPELGSRLASAVEFYDGESDDPAAGSAELRRAVIVDAAAQVEGLPLEETLDRAPLHKATWFAGAAIAGLALLAVWDASAMAIGFARLAQPWADVNWPRQNQLKLVEVVKTVAIGEPFEVAVIDQKGPLPEDVRIEYQFQAIESVPESTESAAMLLVGDQAVARRESVQRPFAYRVVGGDDETMAWTDVAVVEPPQLVDLKINAVPPTYSGLSPETTGGAIRVLAGTVCTAQGTADQPVRSATIELPSERTVALTITNASAETPRLTTTSEGWIAKTPESSTGRSTLRVAIEGADGLTGYSSPRPYEVIADKPPAIEWQEPSGDLFVTERAIVPIRVMVKDNLATRLVRLLGSVSDMSSEATEEEPPARIGSIPLFKGPTEPPQREAMGTDEQRVIEKTIDLLELSAKQGTRLDLLIEATDYQPATGITELPRRVFIVSDEEVEARLAEKQSRLLAEIQRALERQRSAQKRSSELLIDAEAGGPVDRKTLDRLATLEFEQRQASGAIDDPRAGAWRLAKELLASLRQNRLSQPDLEQQLATVSQELGQLAEGVLPEARRQVAAVRRTAKRSPEMQAMAPPLRSAGTIQAEASERLEAIAEALTGWADYQRFAGEIAKMRDGQRELAQITSKLAAAAATGDPMAMAENRAAQQKALASQAEISRRFTTLRKAMQRLLDSAGSGESGNPDSARDAVADALAEAEQRSLAGDLRDASRNLARERFGRAQAPQERAAEGLDKMLEALRGRTEADPAEMIKELREAQERLAELERQAKEMRQQGQDDPKQRQQMANQAERTARALERMKASGAAGSTQQGAQSLSGKQSGKEKLAQAEQNFQEAQKQIEKKIAELEEEQTERMLDRLMAQIDGYIERQEQVNKAVKSVEIVGGDLRQAVDRLSEEQAALEKVVRESAADLAQRAVFELVLSAAAGEMQQVVRRLSTLKLDRTTHRHGAMALAQLKRIAEVLRSTPPPQEPKDKKGGGGGEGGGSKPPSPIDVAELKMLRMMQLDLIDRTEALEADTDLPQEDRMPSARQLGAEQRRLAELALEMAQRNNDPDAEESQ